MPREAGRSRYPEGERFACSPFAVGHARTVRGSRAPVLIRRRARAGGDFTWFLETVLVMIGPPLAFAVRRRFPLSSFVLVLLWLPAVILIVAGRYTYARVPLGAWAMEWFGWTRNNYDKLGHFAQSFVPAVLVREILLRASLLRFRSGAGSPRSGPSRWLPFTVVASCLALSALYELIECLTALACGAAAEDFLARRATFGTRNQTWRSPCSARCSPPCLPRLSTIDR